ncbi:hypothetical protein [Bradyrhizobium sp. LHD-71]|uniref:hypothetical protein n=1 Tax=Bradyrhizobium sp. LHD-71 TaxID=3072141 RepID=UPI0028102DBD|nr:hypothetical protein [Bradyrhizobium sp. LHD-71]MDQ8731005.1 hypothetical protein [Bradyrhizobium sp. LHD-71]
MLIAQAKLLLSRATAALLKIFERSYEPSKYYMRGPGPKAREAEQRAGQSSLGAFSGKVDTGFPQKMRPNKRI